MKCPQCGRWNRANLNRCFYCAHDLPAQNISETHSWKQREDASPRPDLPQASGTILYEVDEETGRTVARPDVRDKLAVEMQSLHIRRKRGEEQMRSVQQHSAQHGYVPPTHSGSGQGNHYNLYAEVSEEEMIGLEPEGEVRPDAIRVQPRSTFQDDYDAMYHMRDQKIPMYDSVPRQSRIYTPVSRRARRRRIGLRRFIPVLAVLMLLTSIALCAWLFIIKPAMENREPTLQEQARITATILDDMAAHTIDIPAAEGSQIYIKELKKSYIVTGGYASVTVADYTWYELNKEIDQPTMEVTLTPYIKTSAGEQKLMDIITYTIDIPQSPITLITPDTTYIEVSTSPYLIQFEVEKNSTVTINGVDFSSFVNTQDGKISYNATVPAVGVSEFVIEVKCEYYRKNTVTLQIYRAPQDVPLELDPTLGAQSANVNMTIKGTTIPGATITVTSPHTNMNTSSLNATGDFSFEAIFEKIGTNVITIVAEKDGLRSELNKEVYYVPYSSTYTPKAWAMDSYGYIDFLNNVELRVRRTQIYLCEGEIVQIVSHKPQLAIMDTDPSPESERLVMLENMSSDTWEVGKRYRVFADAYGVYNSMPRLVGRYTYPPKQ